MRYVLPIAMLLAMPAAAQTTGAPPAPESVESQLDALVVNVDQASLNAHRRCSTWSRWPSNRLPRQGN